jgi:uncharacterized C2H2 Zn-finger protein
MKVYDHDKENYKACPVCGKIIDYHIHGFIRYTKENVWLCRDHTTNETEQALGRMLTKKEREWVEDGISYNPLSFSLRI